MILPRGKFLRLAAGAAALPAVSNIARAQIAQAAELSEPIRCSRKVAWHGRARRARSWNCTRPTFGPHVREYTFRDVSERLL